MKNEPTTEVSKNHPPSMSASPYNSYYLRGCEVAQNQPAYSACLWKISELKTGRPIETASACNQAIQGRRCAAQDMREQELLQGVALFYYPSTYYRNQVINNLTPEHELPRTTGPGAPPSNDPRAANFAGRYREYVAPGANKRQKQNAPLSSVAKSIPDDDGYAAAINAAMQELTTTAEDDTFDIPVGAPTLPTVTPKVVEAVVEKMQQTGLLRLAMEPGESPLAYARRVAASRNQ